MEIHWAAAVLAGIIATLIMTFVILFFRAYPIRVDLPWILGLILVSPEQRTRAYTIGLILHFGAGVLFALVYAVIFAALNVVPGWLWGLFFGVLHYIAFGTGLVLLPAIHPRMGTEQPLPLPGLFGKNLGPLAPTAFFLLHVVYGTVFGALYRLSF